MNQDITDQLLIAGREFRSRLFLGTGKFPSNAALAETIAACGTEMITVALRRVDPTAAEDILDAVPPDVLLLTNTSGAIDASSGRHRDLDGEGDQDKQPREEGGDDELAGAHDWT